MPSATRSRRLADGKLLVDEPADGVVRLTISNPAKRNALDHPILDAISATLTELTGVGGSESQTRCVIVTGAHGMFSAGYDIGEIPDDEFEERAEALVAHPFTEAIEALEGFPHPTLAALPGHAIGGGLELALACDLRVARDGIKLGMPPAKLGLVYSHTGLRRFIDAIGATRTRELFLLGRYITAPTALAWGLVNRVFDDPALMSEARRLAHELAAGPTVALGLIRRLYWESPENAFEEQLDLECRMQRIAGASADFGEGVKAFLEKRPTQFAGK